MSAFSQIQLDALTAPLAREAVKLRGKLSYVEGWHVIAEANRIFGFDNWTRETLDMQCVTEKPRAIGEQQVPGFGVTYICKVRVIACGIVREGSGAGHGIDRDLGLAHESAVKEAETDAMKRALITFGNPFGLALYDKAQVNVADESEVSRLRYIEECKIRIAELGALPDPKELLIWWNSDTQKQARRDFDLNPGELIILKNLVTASVDQKRKTASQ